MRTAITIGIKHGGAGYEVLALPDVPLHKQKAQIKEGRALREHPVFERVEMWESGRGKTKDARFNKPKPATPPPPPAPPPAPPAPEEPEPKKKGK